MLTQSMVGGSYKFSDLLRNTNTKTKTKKKKQKKKHKNKSDPSQIGYPARKSNLNIIMKGPDGNLYKNKRYKKTKRWVKVSLNKKRK